MVDLNAERIAAWHDSGLNQLSIYEPGGQASDLRWIEAFARTVAAHALSLLT